MQTSPEPWIGALRHSHDRLQALVGPLGQDQLEQRSYASEWSIAQVLSHIGSGAEIFGLFLEAGLAGQDPPGRDAFGPIWNTWNAKDPQAQAADGLRADEATAARAAPASRGVRPPGLWPPRPAPHSPGRSRRHRPQRATAALPRFLRPLGPAGGGRRRPGAIRMVGAAAAGDDWGHGNFGGRLRSEPQALLDQPSRRYPEVTFCSPGT